MMNEDNRFDELLGNAAQQYNQPLAAVPRDEMWAAIEAAQTERAQRSMRIVSPASHRPLRRYTWLGAAAAAVLLVATGVGLGRWSMDRGAPNRPAPKAVASTDGTGSGQAIAGSDSGSVDVSASPSASGGEPESAVASAPRVDGPSGGAVKRTSRGPSNIARSGGAGSTVRGHDRPPLTSPGAFRQEGPYQVAANRHLANAEALLTAFRTDSRDARMDAQLSIWARDLLSNTRLLLDSPAADDPQRARLLGDLELVLAQIVQLSPGAAAQDRELIEGSIRSGQVMTRLRSAIPAGPTRGL